MIRYDLSILSWSNIHLLH